MPTAYYRNNVSETLALTEASIETGERGPRRAGDPARLVADARAAQALGWKPRFVDVSVIMRHALA
ncbi:MAG: hypothetical protein H7251_08615 [Acetobacteraceae bacterium]|nr:hypothetical protein [Acetobacteraceae bacterium]